MFADHVVGSRRAWWSGACELHEGISHWSMERKARARINLCCAMASLLLVSFVANPLAQPDWQNYQVSNSSTAAILFVSLLVGVPLGWGVYSTFLNCMKLFQPHSATFSSKNNTNASGHVSPMPHRMHPMR